MRGRVESRKRERLGIGGSSTAGSLSSMIETHRLQTRMTDCSPKRAPEMRLDALGKKCRFS